MTHTAVITGASAGIGAATARHLAAEGFDVVLGARRVEQLEAVATSCGGRAIALDVTDPSSVATFVAEVGPCRVLVNNAGGAFGADPMARVSDAEVQERWQRMYDTNVLGLARLTASLLPALEESGDGHVVNVVSLAGFQAYPGGGGYVAAKHAARGITGVLRLELLGRPVRVTEVDPGMVETEFAAVAMGRADANELVYAGMTPLTADDVAEVIRFAVTRPSHVNLDRIVVQPRDQASAWHVHRER
ncbi:MAG: SDR family NAD(P)-dependent oxidoreductase [Acidimicrobiia bacterium]